MPGVIGMPPLAYTMSIELETVNKLIDQKAYDDAIVKANELLSKGEGIADELEFAIVRALTGKKLIAEAVARLVLLTQKNPLQETYYHFLGGLFMRMELWDKAFDAYGSAIELNPKEASFFGSLAECCRARNDTDAAFAAYERALQLADEKSALDLEAEEFTKPFVAGGDSIILTLKGIGNARKYAIVGLSEDKETGIYIPVGDLAELPEEDDIKEPHHPLFSLKKTEAEEIFRDRLMESLTISDQYCMALYDQPSFEYAVYRKNGA